MVPKSAVLVIVDAQNGFIREHSAPVIPVICDLVGRWEQAGGSVVFTRYINYPGSPFERMIHWTDMQAGATSTDIARPLQSYADRADAVIDKNGYTLFNAEGAVLVRDRGWTDLYVCGIATESCVLKTAVDAFERDLTPWLIRDASASHAGQAAHDAGLLVASRFIGPGQLIGVTDIAAILDPVRCEPSGP